MVRIFRDESGQAAVVMALSIACICGMLGLTVDTGVMFRQKRILQTAADAAAISGAAEVNFGDATAAALAAASQNNVTNGTGGYAVTVNTPPLSGPNTGTAGYVEVIATENVSTYFMRVFGVNALNVSARAVASLGPSQACIYTLDPSGSDISVKGSGTLALPNCGLIIDSSSSNAVDLTGSATISAKSIGIVGGVTQSGSSNLSPTPVTGIVPVSNPLGFLPSPTYNASSCLADPHISQATTIGPAVSGGTICYSGLTITGGPVTLNPGTYVITGGFSMSGSSSLSGSGVTLYLAAPSGSVSLTGSGVVTLSAPTSGTYDGILFFEAPGDTNAMKVAGSSNSTYSGVFYAPSAALNLTGSSSAVFNADLVSFSLSISGSGSLKDYVSPSGTSPISSPRIVE